MSWYSFPLFKENIRVGEITKKWRGFQVSGLLTEAFTDADTLLVDFGSRTWSEEEKALIMSAAISIDFDFFERRNN